MKVFLLHRDRDFEPRPALRDEIYGAMLSGNLFALGHALYDRERRGAPYPTSDGDETLEQDLELDTLWSAMAGGDEFLFEMARRTVLSSLEDPEAITYRQQVLADCLEHPEIARKIYQLSIEALASEREAAGLWQGARPEYILHRAVRLLKRYLDFLVRLRELADEHAAAFRSEGFVRFFAMLREELSDEYLEAVERRLRELELKGGLLESAELGKGDKGQTYIVHPPPRPLTWRERLPLVGSRPDGYSFELHPRDEAGARALEEIRARGINHIANAVGQSADHVNAFFTRLRLELAFYLGCLNLRKRLADKGEPTCTPEALPTGRLALDADGIYDVCLSLHLHDPVVGNDLHADGKSLVMITGANQGGKSTLLRSVGLAQLMMQCGMFAGAESFRAGVSSGVFTHYKREEDATMEGGKLDEELGRMSDIADRIQPGALLLCNESFASTNEREGSEIARQVVRAMVDKRIKVVFVTHMYDLAHSFHEHRLPIALFLRAERRPDGSRTFKLREGEPLPTSFGEDSYRRVFGGGDAPPQVAARGR